MISRGKAPLVPDAPDTSKNFVVDNINTKFGKSQ